MTDMICHKVYELLMSILTLFSHNLLRSPRKVTFINMYIILKWFKLGTVYNLYTCYRRKLKIIYVHAWSVSLWVRNCLTAVGIELACMLPLVPGDLTVSKRTGTSNRIEIHFRTFNHLSRPDSFVKLFETLCLCLAQGNQCPVIWNRNLIPLMRYWVILNQKWISILQLVPGLFRVPRSPGLL
jgi:hypothetical protein